MLQVLENNESIKMVVQNHNDLDIIRYLFPNNIIELDVVGNNLIAIIKEDTTN